MGRRREIRRLPEKGGWDWDGRLIFVFVWTYVCMIDEWYQVFICAGGIGSEVAITFAKVDVDVDFSWDWRHCC